MSVTTSTFLLRCSTAADTDSITVEVPFYPPDTISGKNVFMKMVCGVSNGFEFAANLKEGAAFLISCLDFPQSVGTISDTKSYDCQRSNALGIVAANSDRSAVSPSGPLILTYIPDGLRTIRFRIDTLNNGKLENCIQNSMMFTIMLQFEVSGTR